MLKSLSVIIPAYNEESSLKKVVDATIQTVSHIAEVYEIIIVNDGSKDNTGQIGENLAREHERVKVIHHPSNLGFGIAQHSGLKTAIYDYIVLIPADNQFTPQDLEKYIPLLKNADVVLGVRSNRKDPLHRRVNTFLFRLIVRVFFGIKLRDINWVNLFKREILDGVDSTAKGFAINTEIVVKTLLKGGRFKEVEVKYLPRTTGVATGDNPLNVFITVIELIKLWVHLH